MPSVTVRTKEGVAKFGRAGLRFTREPSTHEVTEDQLSILRAEPSLEVETAASRVPLPEATAADEELPEKRRGRK